MQIYKLCRYGLVLGPSLFPIFTTPAKGGNFYTAVYSTATAFFATLFVSQHEIIFKQKLAINNLYSAMNSLRSANEKLAGILMRRAIKGSDND